MTAYFSNSGIALAPDAFSCGPQILEILPNAGSNSGRDTVAIYGYGFGEDPSKVSAHMGSAAATVQKIDDLSSLSGHLGLNGTYPFPLQRITVTTTPAAAGNADIALAAPSGSTTVKLAFQFLQSEQVFAKAGLVSPFTRARACSNFSLAQFIQTEVETRSKKIPLFEAQ